MSARRAFFVALMVVCLGWPGLARSAVLLEFQAPGPVSVAPGGTFSFAVALSLDAGDSVTGFDYYLVGAGDDYESGFSIFSRTSDLTDFSNLTTSDSEVVNPVADAILAPVNVRSLGAYVADLDFPVTGVGTYPVAVFVLTVSPFVQPGTYTVNAFQASWIDENFEEYALADSGGISVEVVPEPSIAVLMLTGLLVVFRRRRVVPGVFS